jgi:hypothetical protein
VFTASSSNNNLTGAGADPLQLPINSRPHPSCLENHLAAGRQVGESASSRHDARTGLS